jgi:hypothetical protein
MPLEKVDRRHERGGQPGPSHRRQLGYGPATPLTCGLGATATLLRNRVWGGVFACIGADSTFHTLNLLPTADRVKIIR